MNAQPAVKISHDDQNAGKPLAFKKTTLTKIKKVLARYPKGKEQSAVIPVLKMAQTEFGGWLSTPAMELVAQTLRMPYIRVYEVATFYTMFNLQPVGKYHVQVCTNCSCMIRGSAAIVEAVKESASLQNVGDISKDGLFTYHEVECLGACVDAPMMQVNDHYYTHLTPEKTAEILEDLKKGTLPDNATPSKGLEEF